MSERVCALVIAGWEIAVARAVSPDLADLPVIIEEGGRVSFVSLEAVADGVAVGMKIREAQARSPMAVTVERDQRLALDEFEPIVESVEELTPAVEVSSPGVLVFRASGASRAYGGEGELLDRIFSVAPVLPPLTAPDCGGARVGGALARGRFTAVMAAQMAATGGVGTVPPSPLSGPPAAQIIIPDGEEQAFLGPLSVGILGLELQAHDLPETLMLLGVETLGDLACLPADVVTSRFGEAGRLGHLLARGIDIRPLLLRSPTDPLVAACQLDPPVSGLDELTFAAKVLLDRLDAELDERVLSTTKLRVEAIDEGGGVHLASWRCGAGGLGGAAERVRWHLESWRPEGGLVEMCIFPEELGPQNGRQLRLAGVEGGADPETEIRVEKALARLQAVLGPSGVLEVTPRGGRLPLERTSLTPAGRGGPLFGRNEPAVGGKRRDAPWPGALPPPSPALVCSGPADFDDASISRATGPFRYRLRWWSSDEEAEMEIWQLLLEDGTALLASQHSDGSWSLDGVYD